MSNEETPKKSLRNELYMLVTLIVGQPELHEILS